MMGRLWNAFRVEWSKALRNRILYIGPVLMVVTVAAAAASPLFRGAPYGYAFVAYATSAALNHLGMAVLLAFSATLVANEVSHGTLRLLLVRPILRHELLLAKFLLATLYASILVLVTAVAAWLLPLATGTTLGVTFGGELIFTDSAMREAYLIGMALSLVPLLAIAACGLCISVLARRNGTAVLAALGGWLTLEVIKHPLGIAPLVVTSYLEVPWRVFASQADGVPAAWLPAAWSCVAVSAVTAFLALTLALASFDRKNLAS